MTHPLFPTTNRHPLIDDPQVNRTFDEILMMDDAAFTEYVRAMRAAFLRCWDEQGIAPTHGWSWEKIDKDFAQLAGYDVHAFWTRDERTQQRVIWNTAVGHVGSSVNAWNISNMYKTRINYSSSADDGRSIYDFFSRPDYFEKYLPYARRHFLRDSFYSFAMTVVEGQPLPHHAERRYTTGRAYVEAFAAYERVYHEYELLLEARENVGIISTGYNGRVREAAPLSLSYEELCDVQAQQLLPKTAYRNVLPKHLNTEHRFDVRQYRTAERLFPAMFRSFRISMCQYAVNFPPLTARLLYETFLSHVQTPTVRVWDPSAGWAGRLLGALSYNRQLPSGEQQHLEYVGTDPNPAFYKAGTSVYEVIRDYYNGIRVGNSLFDVPHRATVYQMGSEEFHTTSIFRDWKGHADLVFTSPPYWHKEAYSDDPNQSYKKFSAYEAWRDSFLARTLRTAYEILNHDRYLLWNIADIKLDRQTMVPLEADSKRIAEELGFEYVDTVAMALTNMPGSNRLNEDGTPTTKNFVQLAGEKYLKYEPVFVFRKP